MAKGSTSHQELYRPSNGSPSFAGGNPTNSVLKHNPGLSTVWTVEEQSILEEGLIKYDSESNIIRYAKIAMTLHNKTVRDVALRYKWMSRKENNKRRKEDHHQTRKGKEIKEIVTDPSAESSGDEISYKELMIQQNGQVLRQISANLSTLQIHENISLFHQARENLLQLLEHKSDEPVNMKELPEINIEINQQLLDSVVIASGSTTIPMPYGQPQSHERT